MTTIIQRPLRGSRISSFYPVKSLPSLASLDSAFQLQEYISLLIRLDVHDVDTIVSVPGKSDVKEKEPEEDTSGEKSTEQERKNDITVDEACWIYEQLRRLAQDLSHPLITMLQQECNRASCPEMKAGEWLYLCVAHGNDGAMEQCCAIDYILHTLDSATALLNSPRAFPSRLQIPQTSHRHFSSLARRLGRIFAHAYFHHREAFEQAEAESSLYARFLALTSKFELVPAEFLVIPPRLSPSDGEDRNLDVQPPRLLAAGVNPSGDRDSSASPPRSGESSSSPDRWAGEARGSGAGNDRSKSTSPPGLGSESPRKIGRNRTDTMVFTEAYNSVIEELAKGEEETKADAASSSASSSGSSEPAAVEEVVASPEDETSTAPLEVPHTETQAEEENKTEAATAEPTPPPSEESDIATAEPSTEPSTHSSTEKSYASVLQATPDAVETPQPEEKAPEEADAPTADEVVPEPAEPAAVPETKEEDTSVPEEPEAIPAPAPAEDSVEETLAATAPSSGPESTPASEEKKEEEADVPPVAPPSAPVEELEQAPTEQTPTEAPAETTVEESVPAEPESAPESEPEPVYLPVAVESVLVDAKDRKEDKEDAEPAAPAVETLESQDQSQSATTAAPDQPAPVDLVAPATESKPAESG